MPRPSRAPITEALVTLGLVLGPAPRSVLAQGPPLDLAWQAPEGCPSARAVNTAVMRLIGPGAHEPLRADVSVRFDASRFRARLAMSGGERELVADDCRAVTEAVVVVLALAIDPSAAERATQEAAALELAEPVPVPPSVAPSDPQPATAAPTSPPPLARDDPPALGPERPTRRRSPPRLQGAALGSIDRGTLPESTVGLGAFGRLELRRATLELGGRWLVPRERTVPGTRAGARLGFFAGAVSVCWALPRPAWRGELCAAGEAGVLRADPFGISRPDPAARAWVAVGPEAGLRVPASRRWSGILRGVVLIPAIRDEYGIDGVGIVHAAPSAMGRVELGLTFRL